MRPMLASPGTAVPTGPEWVHEIKWDGIRALAEVSSAGVRLSTRNENDVTGAWPQLASSGPEPSGPAMLLDGEIVALDGEGRPDFRALRRGPGSGAMLMLFDVLAFDGNDVTGLGWTARRALLASLAEGGLLGAWQLPATYDDGPALHVATREQRLEGIVSKRREAPYLPGRRSTAWLKFPHRWRASYVVGGWRPQVGTTGRLAALLVGEPTATGLAYRGRVGSGIGGQDARLLREILAEVDASPFADVVPRQDARGTHWVSPRVVVDVETHGIGYERLRQPAYVGIRSDLEAGDLDV